MNIIVLLLILILVFGAGGFYVGPPYGYYGGFGIGTVLLIVILVLLFR